MTYASHQYDTPGGIILRYGLFIRRSNQRPVGISMIETSMLGYVVLVYGGDGMHSQLFNATHLPPSTRQ